MRRLYRASRRRGRPFLLDAGLGIGIGDPKDGKTYGIELDLSGLFRMDTKTLADVENIKVQRGLSTINEGRRKFNNPPVEGGDVPMLQEQNWPLKLLAERKLPAETPPPAPTPPPTPTADGEDPAPAEAAAAKAAAEAARADVASMRAALDGQATGLQRFMDSLPALMAAEVAKAAVVVVRGSADAMEQVLADVAEEDAVQLPESGSSRTATAT